MSIFSKAKTVLRNVAGKLLDVDDSMAALAQLSVMEDYLAKHKFNTDVFQVTELVKVLKQKHLVDSICVSTSTGTTIATTNGSEVSEAVVGTALFNYISSEIPKSEAVLIKTKDWYMLLPFKGKIYIVKAAASLSTVELKAIAKEVEAFLVKRKAA